MLAAKDADSDGQYMVGHLYRHGMGIEKNMEHAIYWLTQAAHQFDEEAMLELSDIYSEGNIPIDKVLSYCWADIAGSEFYRDEVRQIKRSLAGNMSRVDIRLAKQKKRELISQFNRPYD